MNERVLNLLSMCFQAREKGYHVFFYFSPHVSGGEIEIRAFEKGWADKTKPTKSFTLSANGKVRYLENSFDEAEAYLKGLLT